MKILPFNKFLVGEVHKGNKILYEVDGDDIYLSNGYVLWKIKKSYCYVDLNRFEEANVKSYLKNACKKKIHPFDEVYSNLYSKYETGRIENMKIFFNADLLKYFDKYTLYMTDLSPVKPIYVSENNECVGLIMPVRDSSNG